MRAGLGAWCGDWRGGLVRAGVGAWRGGWCWLVWGLVHEVTLRRRRFSLPTACDPGKVRTCARREGGVRCATVASAKAPMQPYHPEDAIASLGTALRACTLCRDRFAATATAHAPRPVVWFRPSAQILVAGQAPGARVHVSGIPFDDASGDRLRDWMGVSREQFHDLARVALVPMAFCFPGYDAKGSDLPPPVLCAQTWRAQVLAVLPGLRLRLLVGGAAQRWHLGNGSVTPTVAGWQLHAAGGTYPLPHPSWRNTGWLRKNPWFETDLVPDLRRAVARVLKDEL